MKMYKYTVTHVNENKVSIDIVEGIVIEEFCGLMYLYNNLGYKYIIPSSKERNITLSKFSY